MINDILGKNIEPQCVPERQGDGKHSRASIDKAKKIIDYEVKLNFNEGLKRTIACFLK